MRSRGTTGIIRGGSGSGALLVDQTAIPVEVDRPRLNPECFEPDVGTQRFVPHLWIQWPSCLAPSGHPGREARCAALGRHGVVPGVERYESPEVAGADGDSGGAEAEAVGYQVQSAVEFGGVGGGREEGRRPQVLASEQALPASDGVRGGWERSAVLGGPTPRHHLIFPTIMSTAWGLNTSGSKGSPIHAFMCSWPVAFGSFRISSMS